jgi:hypothetical protein
VPAEPPAGTGPTATTDADEVRRGWTIAAVLWLVAGVALFGLHRQVVATLSGWQGGAESAFEEPELMEPRIDPQLQEVLDELEALGDDSPIEGIATEEDGAEEESGEEAP